MKVHPNEHPDKSLKMKYLMKKNIVSSTTSNLLGSSYKRIYDYQNFGKDFDDYYNQIFPVNAPNALRHTIPNLYLENPIYKISLDDGCINQTSQIQGMLKKYQQSPCCRIHRDESHFVLFGHSDQILDLQLSNDQHFLFSSSGDGIICLWDLSSKTISKIFKKMKEEKKEDGKDHDDAIYAIQISQDDRKILAGRDKSIIIWDIQSGKEISRLEGHDGQILTLVLIPNTPKLLSGGVDKTIILWNYETKEKIKVLKEHKDIVRRIKLSPNCQSFVSGGDDGMIIWDLEKMYPLIDPISHSKGIRSLAITFDSNKLISGSMDHSIKIWDFKTGKTLGEFPNNKSTAYVLMVTKDSKHVISGGWDKIIRFWDLEKMTLVRTMEGHTDTIRTLLIQGDGKIISGSTDKSIRIWDFSSQTEKTLLEGHSSVVRALVLTPNEKYLISAGDDKTLKLWDFEQRELVNSFDSTDGHTEAIKVLLATPDSLQVCSASNDRQIYIWNIDTRRRQLILKGHNENINSMAITLDGLKLISGSGDKTIIIWDLKAGRKLHTLEGHTGYIRSVILTPDCNYIISAAWDTTIRIWDIKTLKPIEILIGHKMPVLVIAISPDGKILASASNDRTIKIWDFDLKEVISSLEGHAATIKSIQISDDSTKIFSGSVDKTIRIWDIETQRQIAILEGHSSTIYSILLVSDSSLLISTGWDQTIRLWPLKRKEKMATLKGPTDAVRCLAISQDGQEIFTGGADTSIRIWNVKSMKQVGIIWGHNGTVFSLIVTNDSERIVSASGDQTIRVWEIEMKTQVKIYKGHKEAVRAVIFVPGEKRIVSGSEDKTIIIWDYEYEKPIGQPLVHLGAVHSLAITTDGRKIISGGNDPCITIWDMRTRDCLVSLEIGVSNTVFALLLTSDSRMITSHLDKTIRIWSLDSKQEIKVLDVNSVIRSLVLTNDERKLISGGEDNIIRIWDLDTMKQINELKGHTGKIKSLVMSPTSNELISGSYDNSIRVWNIDTGNQMNQMQSQGAFYSLVLTPDATKVVGGRFEKAITIWDIKTKKQVAKLEGHKDVIRSIIFTPDSSRIISCSADTTIRVWDLKLYSQILELKGHKDTVFCLLVVENVMYRRPPSASHKEDEEVKGLTDKKILLKEDSPQSSIRHKIPLILISGSYDKTIKLWDLSTGEDLYTLTGHQGAVFCLTIIPRKPQFLSAGSEGTIFLWDLEKLAPIKTLIGHTEAVRVLSLSPDDKILVSGSIDKFIRIWDFIRLKEIACLKGEHSGALRSLVVSPDCKKLVSGSFDGNYCVWDIDSKIVIFKGESNIVSQVEPFFSLGEGRLFGLLGHIVYDFSNETPLFTLGEYESLNEVLFSETRKSFICINKKDELSLRSFQDIAEFSSHFSNIQGFFDDNEEKLGLLIKKSPILLPFYYNFLHIIALFDNKKPFQFKKFQNIQIPLNYFLQVDTLDQTCLDIAIGLNLKSLLNTYMQSLIKSLYNETTTFYQKQKFFAYDFNFEKNNNIYSFLMKLLKIFEKDTTLISQLFECSFLEIDSSCFFENYSSAELKKPLFVVTKHISELRNKESLDKLLDPQRSRFLNYFFPRTDKITDVKCKVCLLKGMTDIDPISLKFHKKIMNFEPENPLFSNKIFQLMIQYKWRTYAKTHLLFKFIGMFIIFLVYLANNIYILPIRSTLLNEKFGNKYDITALVLDIILLTYFSIAAFQEVLQFKRAGFVNYLSSPWNWCDLCLIPLIFAGCIVDIYQISLQYSELNEEVVIYSITFLLFWFRVLSFSRAFEGTGFMIRLVIQVILDMKYFLFMIILFTLAFSSAGFMLQTSFDVSPWNNFTLFYRLMLGDYTQYDADFTGIQNYVLIWILMILFTLLLSVIMLNLLISIIGETFNRVRTAESSMKYYELYSIITEIEDAMSESEKRRLRNEGKIGNYLICLYNENSQFETSETTFQNKVLDQIKEIKTDIMHLGCDVDVINRELKDFRKLFIEEMRDLKNIKGSDKEKEEKGR